jgi:hypothetical protein
MYKYYTKYSYGSVVNVFEFTPSEDLVPMVTVGDETKREYVKDIKHPWAEKQGWERLAAVNLSFFNFSKKPVVLGVDYRDAGFTKASPADTGFKGYELAYKGNELIIADFTESFFNEEIENKAHWAVSLSYSLVLDGKIDIRGHEAFDHYRYRHPRTCIGQKKDGTIVMAVIDGRSKKSRGVTAQQSAQIMLDLGCVKAINADGGGSSQMVYKGRLVNECSDGPYGRAVANALVIYSKKPVKIDQRDYPVLRYGSRGDFVKTMQQKLIKLGYDLGRSGADGSFGLKTLAGLKRFQDEKGLEVDGICGPMTWAKLNSLT